MVRSFYTNFSLSPARGRREREKVRERATGLPNEKKAECSSTRAGENGKKKKEKENGSRFHLLSISCLLLNLLSQQPVAELLLALARCLSGISSSRSKSSRCGYVHGVSRAGAKGRRRKEGGDSSCLMTGERGDLESSCIIIIIIVIMISRSL